MPPTFLVPGAVIDQKFVVLDSIGEGGMGSVCKAKQIGLERIVALKFLNPVLIHDLDSRARFEQEGKILSTLAHKNIAQFYSYGVHDGHPYIAMEFVDGISLSTWIARKRSIPWTEVVRIGIQVSNALSAAHASGIVHRDLKPENIILRGTDSSGDLSLIDFGLSKVILSDQEFQKLTQTGQLIGTVHYLSPELCQGQKADIRSDIYSLGCILYECIASVPPFKSDSPMVILHMHQTERPVSINKQYEDANCPPEVETVIMHCLEKNREKRYRNAEELTIDLERLSTNRFDEITARDSKKRIPLLPAFIALTVIFLIGLSAINQSRKSMPEKPDKADAAVKIEKSVKAESRVLKELDKGVSEQGKLIAYSKLIELPAQPEAEAEAISKINEMIPRLTSDPMMLYVAYQVRGSLQYELRQFDKAAISFSKAISMCRTKDGQLKSNAMSSLLGEARSYLALKNYEKAQASAEAAHSLAKKIDSSDTIESFDMPELLSTFRRKDPTPEYLLANIFYGCNRIDEATKWMEADRALSLNIEQYSHYTRDSLFLARIFEKQKQTEKVNEIISGLEEFEFPEDSYNLHDFNAVGAYQQIGHWFRDHKEYNKARQYLSKGLQIALRRQFTSFSDLLTGDLSRIDRMEEKHNKRLTRKAQSRNRNQKILP